MTGDVFLGLDGVTDVDAVRDAGRRFAYELGAWATDRDPAGRPPLPDVGGEAGVAYVLAAAVEVLAGEIVPALVDAAGAHGLRLRVGPMPSEGTS